MASPLSSGWNIDALKQRMSSHIRCVCRENGGRSFILLSHSFTVKHNYLSPMVAWYNQQTTSMTFSCWFVLFWPATDWWSLSLSLTELKWKRTNCANENNHIHSSRWIRLFTYKACKILCLWKLRNVLNDSGFRPMKTLSVLYSDEH